VLVYVLLERLLIEKAPDAGKAYRARQVAGGAVLWGMFMLAGALIASVQILPMIDTMAMSQRSEGGLEFAASFSSVPPNILTYLVPNLFGNRVDVPFVGGWFYYWESLGYLGLVPVALVLYGLIALPFRRWFPAMVLIVIGLILSLGAHTPLFKLYLALVPVADLFRSPGRFCLLVTLFGSLLAARSLDVWLESIAPSRRHAFGSYAAVVLAVGALVSLILLSASSASGFSQWMTGLADSPERVNSYQNLWPRLMGVVRVDLLKALVIFTLTAVLLLVGVRRPALKHAFAVVLAVLVVLDLFHFGHRFLKTESEARFGWPSTVTELIREEGGPGVRIVCPPETRWVDYGGMHEIGVVGGHDAFVIERHMRYLNRSRGRPLDRFWAFVRVRKGGPLIRHLGPEFLLAFEPLENGRNRTVAGFSWFKPYKKLGKIHVYRDDNAPPRAALVHAVELIEDEVETYRRMEQADFDIRETVLVESKLPDGFASPEPLPPEAQEQCEITQYEANRVEFELEVAAQAVLVLSDSYIPGWRAYVDGEEVPVVHANRIMRAIPVPPGKHRIVMSYLPTSFIIGAVISMISVLLLAAGFLVRWRFRIALKNS
jgi:hypothetical protein